MRLIAMYLCQMVYGKTLPNIAHTFNVGQYSSVSQKTGRLKREMAENIKIKKQVNMLSQIE